MAKTKVLYFWTPGCIHCGPYGEMVADVAGELNLKVERIDCTEDGARAARYNVRGVPTVLLTYDDHVMMEERGPKKKDHIRKRLAEVLDDKRPKPVKKAKRKKRGRRSV